MTMIEYRNSFHDTVARVRVADSDICDGDGNMEPMALLTKRQIRRVEKALCGMADCLCGGHQNFHAGLSPADTFGRTWCGGGKVTP